MKLATGKVIGCKVVVDGGNLPDGALVTVLTREADKPFDTSSELATELDIALAEDARGESVTLAEALRQLRAD